MSKMAITSKRGGIRNSGKIFSLVASIIMISGSFLIGISFNAPNVSAGPVTLNKGDLWVEQLSDFGKILKGFTWNSQAQDVRDPMTTWGYNGLVLDQDNYDHTPPMNIADSYMAWPYGSQDDLTMVTAGSLLINNATTQKSFASFKNSGAGTGDANDIRINQTCWSVVNKDWAILQWTLYNTKGVDITNVALGLELSLSHTLGPNYGVGGDSGDDTDGYDAAEGVYWAQDDSGVTIGFGSAIITDPITHYYSVDYHNTYTWDQYKVLYQDDTWLYNRLHAPSSVVGATPGNRSSTVGWDGFTLSPGTPRALTLVVAVNSTYSNMINAIKDAQYFYHNVVTGLLLTEFSDDSATQRIEVYNNGREPTDLVAGGFAVSNDGGATFLPGSWNPPTVPTYGYSVFTVTGTPIGPEGDSISLWFDPGSGYKLVDGPFAFGQEGTVPDPLDGGSVARRFDTSAVAYTNDWLQTTVGGATWGSQNNVGYRLVSPPVVLNRVMFNPNNIAESYIEVYYRGVTISIDNYMIVCDDAFIILPGNTLDSSNPFFVLNYTQAPALFNNMNAGGDNVYFYNSAGNLLDMVGWTSAHTPGYFMGRMPDATGTTLGFNDPSSVAAGWFFDQQPTMMITEIAADTPTTAKIEVYNPRGGDNILTPGVWDLECGLGSMTGIWSANPIPTKKYTVFTQSGGAGVNQEGDTFTLKFTGSIAVDSVGFGTHGPAPDPLTGESSGRFWDSGSSTYTGDWNRNASTGPTWGTRNDVPSLFTSPNIVFQEIMFYPSSDPAGHFVIVYNKGFSGVAVTGWNIVSDSVYSFPTFTIPAYNLVILRYSELGSDFQNMCDSMSIPEDNIYLYDNTGRLVDMVGWNTAHFQGMSVKREPFGNGTHDGYNDASSEAAGWVFNSPIQIIVTEISDSESAQAQIEVYNPWYPPVDMSVGFTFNSTSTGGQLAGSWYISTADIDGHAVFNVSTPGALDFDGDTISFHQNGFLNEEFSYGNEGTIPDPLPGESVERVMDFGYYTDYWCRNVSMGPNFGSANNVPMPNSSVRLKLNEILFNPSVASNGFVEIFTNTSLSMDISGYRIVGNTEFIVPDGTILDPNDPNYYLIQSADPCFFSALSPSRDNVYLYNANGSLIDMAGWSSSHATDMTMHREPEGNGTRDGFDDVSSVAAGWRFDSAPTIFLINVYTDASKYGDRGENVSYNLTIKNKHGVDDTVEIDNSSSPGGWQVIILDEFGVLLTDTTGDGLPDIFVSAGSQVNISVVIVIPPDIITGFLETTIISVQSTVNTLYGDATILTTKVAPFILYNKSASPQVINILGTGYDEETTITLSVSGSGYPLEGVASNYADIVFVVDDTGSMGGVINDIKQKILDITQVFQREITSVRFGLVTYKDAPERDQALTFNANDFILAVNALAAGGGGDWPEDVYGALEMAINSSWRPGNISKIIILIGDAEDHNPYSPCPLVASAVRDEWGIFTSAIACSITPPFMPETFMAIAENGSGIYAYYNGLDPETLAQTIVDAVLTFVPLINISAKDDDVTDSNPMIQDVLPDYIQYVPGSASIPPDNIYKDVDNNTILEWNVSEIIIGETWTATFNVTSSLLGPQLSNVVSESRVSYIDWRNSTETVIFPESWITVLPPSPMPPTLYIDTLPNENDIYLNWDPPMFPGTDHYLIFRSANSTEFDFSTPWIDTSNDTDPLGGLNPARLSWNHTGAADPFDGEYSEQWYYCIRSVNAVGEMSYTSRTVGKWTRMFAAGNATFSFPLQPLFDETTEYYALDMNARFIKWMDSGTHTWIQHDLGEVGDDTTMKVGKGYEVDFAVPTRYTFLGMPGAMIRYKSDAPCGFDFASEADTLSASVDSVTGDVTLNWAQPASMLPGYQYHVYYATTRDGFFGTRGVDYMLLAINAYDNLVAVHAGAALAGTQFYYMVIPVNASNAEGASTYSIGVWTSDIIAEYDTIAIPLQLIAGDQSASWYCGNIDGTVGINYFIYSQQRWGWHSTRMPEWAFDPIMVMTEGYQISISAATKFTFIGI